MTYGRSGIISHVNSFACHLRPLEGPAERLDLSSKCSLFIGNPEIGEENVEISSTVRTVKIELNGTQLACYPTLDVANSYEELATQLTIRSKRLS